MKERSGPDAQSGSGPDRSQGDGYLVDAVLRACDLLQVFKHEGESLRLCDLAARTGINTATAFRIPPTREKGGLVRRVDKKYYRLNIKPLGQRKYRIGNTAQSAEFAFTRDVTDSIIQATEVLDVDLIVMNNHYSPRTAVWNAELLVKEKEDGFGDLVSDERARRPGHLLKIHRRTDSPDST